MIFLTCMPTVLRHCVSSPPSSVLHVADLVVTRRARHPRDLDPQESALYLPQRALSAQGWPLLALSLPPPAPPPPLLLRRRRLLLLLLLPLLLLLLLLDPPLLLLLLVPAGRANTLFSTSSVAAWACASTVMPSWPNGAGRTMRARCSSPARRVGETWHRLRPRPPGTERRRRC